MFDRCKSCGILFIQHLGIIGTCAELQQARAECDRLQMELELTKMEAYEELARAVGSIKYFDVPGPIFDALEKLREVAQNKHKLHKLHKLPKLPKLPIKS